MPITIYQVDSFTEEIFKGNPAGVCLLEAPISEELMQQIAAEMNLSETAFVVPHQEELNAFSIRYFTPTTEVGLCGHATLAAAKVIFQQSRLGVNLLTFYAGKEVLTVQKRSTRLVMNFPQYGLEKAPTLPDEFWEALSITSLRGVYYSSDLGIILIELGEGSELLGAQPDFQTLSRLDVGLYLEGLILTTQDTQALPYQNAFDCMSRCFFPWIGITEDPVTGVAHTLLGPYWAKKLNKNELKAYQASKRGGEMTLKLLENSTRLEITGEACIVFKAELFI